MVDGGLTMVNDGLTMATGSHHDGSLLVMLIVIKNGYPSYWLKMVKWFLVIVNSNQQ